MAEHRSEPVTPQAAAEIAQVDERVRARRREALIRIAVGLGLVVVAVFSLLALQSSGRAESKATSATIVATTNGQKVSENKQLLEETRNLLQAQKDQFNRCKNKPASTPGCTAAVAPEIKTLPKPADPVLISGPAGKTGAQGIQGIQGPPPSPAEVAQAVASYCASGVCKGDTGAAGSSVTPSQVAAAVSTYCNDRGQCQGPRGKDSVEPGPRGPGPDDAQVLSAVTTYCSGGVCKGENGSDATDAQVKTAVETYCGEHGGCKGADGDDSTVPGPSGPEPINTKFVDALPDDPLDGCMFRTTYKRSNDTDFFLDAPAPQEQCL